MKARCFAGSNAVEVSVTCRLLMVVVRLVHICEEERAALLKRGGRRVVATAAVIVSVNMLNWVVEMNLPHKSSC